jgi:hypothetical protein
MTPGFEPKRDNVFGWLLAKIFWGSPLGSRLVLKGGNALRKGYFPNTRYSSDLDFTTDGGLNPEELKLQLIHDFYGKPGSVIIKTQMDITEYERRQARRNASRSADDADRVRGSDRNDAGQPLDPENRQGLLRFEPAQDERGRPAAASTRSASRWTSSTKESFR